MRRKTKPRARPARIYQVLARFNSEEQCIKHLESLRWPKGLECLRCQSKRVFTFKTTGKTGKPRYLYECVDCRYQCSVTTGTLFHDSHLPLTKWFLAICLICSAEEGISAKFLQSQLGGPYKTSWYMAQRIRLSMQEHDGFCGHFAGICEVDETYVGAKSKGPRGAGSRQ